MKPLFLLSLAFALSATAARGQQRNYPLAIDTLASKASFRGVVEVPGATKQELYSRAKGWFSSYFTSSKAVLDMEDEAGGTLVGKGYGFYTSPGGLTDNDGRVWKTIRVEVKDGRYRYEITDFYFGPSTSPAVRADADTRVDRLLFSQGNYDKEGNPRRLLRNVGGGITAAVARDTAALKKAMTTGGNW